METAMHVGSVPQDSHEHGRVAALPAQVVRQRHQEAAEHRKQDGDVVRLPGLLKHGEETFL